MSEDKQRFLRQMNQYNRRILDACIATSIPIYTVARWMKEDIEFRNAVAERR